MKNTLKLTSSTFPSSTFDNCCAMPTLDVVCESCLDICLPSFDPRLANFSSADNVRLRCIPFGTASPISEISKMRTQSSYTLLMSKLVRCWYVISRCI